MLNCCELIQVLQVVTTVT